MQRNSFPSSAALTLIEGCIVLAIASIPVGTAVPSFKDFKQEQTMNGIAVELVSDLQFARSEAVARQEGVRFTTESAGGGSCVLIHTGTNGDCQCAAGGTAQCGNGAALVKSSFFPSTSGGSVLPKAARETT